MRVALHTWNTGPAEAWDAHGNVVVETDLTDEDRWVLLPDAHRQGHRCLEPSSVGLWLATDGLWSTSPRNARLEADDRKGRGLALARLHRDTKTR